VFFLLKVVNPFSLLSACSLAKLFYMEEETNHVPPNQGKNYRTDAHLSQADVAFLLGIKNVGRISEWENGLSNPSLEHSITLGLIYHHPPDQIYYDLRKKLLKKLEVRQKLLRELKERERKKRKDQGG
jgi:transcriptional regulator with XRE-family HTH domain